MLVLLPPSETKRPGGDGAPLDLFTLSFPSLHSRRRVLVRALESLATSPDAMMAALRLGPTQGGEVARNRVLSTAPTTTVLDRYTGVLYDALEPATLTAPARAFAGRHLAVHSALFGPLRALDHVPAYRLSHDSRLPGVTLRSHWGTSISAALDETPGLVLDLRSNGYVALGAAPARPDSVSLRVVAGGGRSRALSHDGKTAKGRFTRAILQHGHAFRSVGELLDWAGSAGFLLQRGPTGALDLMIGQRTGSPARP